MTQYILAADVGGTKTNIGVFSSDDGCQRPLQFTAYASRDFKCLEDLVASFMTDSDYPLSGACFGVAGPVLDDTVRFTNLPWQVRRLDLEKLLAIDRVKIVNDMVALGHGLPFLANKDIVCLQKGQPAARGAIALVAPGTGLGMAYKVWSEGEYGCYPSEGGHGHFAPATTEQLDLIAKLATKIPLIHWEDVCSGPGIANIYGYVKASGHYGDEDERSAAGLDLAPDIIARALKNGNGLCRQSIDMFCQILAVICRNLVLTIMATNGIYVGGGIVPRILPMLDAYSFRKFFIGDDKYSSFLSNVPISVIDNSFTPLYGCAALALAQD